MDGFSASVVVIFVRFAERLFQSMTLVSTRSERREGGEEGLLSLATSHCNIAFYNRHRPGEEAGSTVLSR